MNYLNLGNSLSILTLLLVTFAGPSAHASLSEVQCAYGGGSEDSYGKYLGLNAPSTLTITNPESDEPTLVMSSVRQFLTEAPTTEYSPHLKGKSALSSDGKTRTFVFNSWYTPHELCNSTTCYDKRIGLTVTLPANYASEPAEFAAQSALAWAQRPHPVAGGAILPAWFTAWDKAARFELDLTGCMVR